MANGVLDQVKDAIKKNYYDPKFKGVDIEAVFARAREQIKNAATRDELMLIVAQAAQSLDDSHTRFLAPKRAADIDYGWYVSMVGEHCYVTAIKPKSDAEAKGLKVGDRVLSIDGFGPSRETLWHIYNRYYNLIPSASVRMVVASPGDKQARTIDVLTKITKTSAIVQQCWDYFFDCGYDRKVNVRWKELQDEVFIWRLPTFSISQEGIDEFMAKSKKFKHMILDLRGNRGGAIVSLQRLIGYFHDKDVKIGDRHERKGITPLIAKSRGKDVFNGTLIVLVDHDSASASEIFARIIQLEKRGKVIGDKTSGAVMTARSFPMSTGVGLTLNFGMTVTVNDLVMPDGKSLEKLGVTPDEIRLPTNKDLAEGKDPVLAYAIKLLGIEVTPETAGKYFPHDWN